MNEIARFFAERGQPMHVAANTKIIARGNKVSKVYQVQSGQVLIHSTSVHDREIGIDIIKPGGVFGLVSVIKDVNAAVDATALTECDLLFVERGPFDEAVRSDPLIASELLTHAIDLLAERTRKVEELAVYSFKSRLARWLLGAFGEVGIELNQGATIQVTVSQKLIAVMAGVSRETVNRQLKKWADEEIIDISGKNLRLLKPAALRRMAGDPDHLITKS